VGYYLSDKADKIPLCGKFTAHVPVAIGVVETREDLYGDSIILSEIYSMAKYMQQDSVLGSMIDHIYVLESGELELYTKMGYHTIAFGRADATMIEKLNKLKIFYREGMTKVGWDKYSVINLKYKGQVVCERKTAEVPVKPKKKEEPEKQETEKQDIN
jgi:cell division protein FtsQ